MNRGLHVLGQGKLTPALLPGLHQEPFDGPFQSRGKLRAGALAVEQDVVLFRLGVQVESEGQLRTAGIKRLDVDARRPPVIQEEAEPQGRPLQLRLGVGGNLGLRQDGGQRRVRCVSRLDSSYCCSLPCRVVYASDSCMV